MIKQSISFISAATIAAMPLSIQPSVHLTAPSPTWTVNGAGIHQTQLLIQTMPKSWIVDSLVSNAAGKLTVMGNGKDFGSPTVDEVDAGYYYVTILPKCQTPTPVVQKPVISTYQQVPSVGHR